MAVHTPSTEALTLVLASTSVYRRELLSRLRIPFEVIGSEVEETPRPEESPKQRAVRLAHAKAEAVARGRRRTVVIGSDQVAALDGQLLRKPHTVERAEAQLAASSGRAVDFFTAATLIDCDSGVVHSLLDHTVVHFRPLSQDEITRYIAREQPLDCAGSFKCEGLGISLFEAIVNRDPSALIGLPLIAVAAALRDMGWELP